MSKRKIIIILFIVVGAIAIAFGYWTLSPLFYDVRVSEDLPPMAQPESQPRTITSGQFAGLEGHNASGTAKIINIEGKLYVRFEEDFKVTNGPDLFVYLGKNGNYDPAANLGRLKGTIGSQNYEIPEAINLDDYDSVWVWCRAFSVAFGVANFR